MGYNRGWGAILPGAKGWSFGEVEAELMVLRNKGWGH